MVGPTVGAELATRAAAAANTPVIGKKKTVTRVLKSRTIVEETSFQLRIWEVAAAGLVVGGVYVAMTFESEEVFPSPIGVLKQVTKWPF